MAKKTDYTQLGRDDARGVGNGGRPIGGGHSNVAAIERRVNTELDKLNYQQSYQSERTKMYHERQRRKNH